MAFALLIVLSLLSSCSNRSQNPKDVQNLSSTVFLSDEILGTPYHICSTGKYLILGNLKNDTILEVYTNEGEKVNQFLVHGEGPGEALRILNIQYSAADNCIYLPDAPKHSMYKILESEFTKENPNINTVFHYQPDKLSEDKMIWNWWKCMSNGKLMAANATSKGMLAYFDTEIKEYSCYEMYPDKEKVSNELSEWANMKLYSSCGAVSPNANRLAVAYYGADILGFAQLDGHSIKTKFLKEKYPNDIYVVQYDENNVQGAFTSESIRHYVSVTASDNYVYALYCGEKEKDCPPGLMRADRVKCYNWTGDLIKEIQLDNQALQIAVSPDDKWLYAVNESPDTGYTILKYAL